MTAAIVLAAGVGRRLASVTRLPKWLTPVGDTSPSEKQLVALERVGVTDVIVVVGQDTDTIAEAVVPWRGRLDIELVENPHSATRNNWYSLLLGIERWTTTGHEDFLVLNSDLFAGETWMEETIRRARATDLEAGLAVDPASGSTDEAMKVGLDGAGERILRIGKVGVDRPGGEYVGLGWWGERAGTELRDELRGFVDDPERTDHWYEHAIDEHLRRSGRYRAVPVPSTEWVEIDDADDLVRAETLRM